MEQPILDQHLTNTNAVGYLSILGLSLGTLCNIMARMVAEYDFWFKALSLVSIIMVILVNAGKVFEELYTIYLKIKGTVKKNKKK